MTSFKKLLIITMLCSSSVSLAYIPPYSMILARTAENHGHGAYVINQDVLFSHSEEPYIVHERWTILTEGQLRLDVEGRNQLKSKVHLTYLYKDGRRTYIDENGVKKTERAPEDWIEPFLHFRTSKAFRSLAVAKGVTPADSARPEPKFNDKEPMPVPEAFVRLSRVDGTTAYAIGNPTAPDSSTAAPGLWIEQDRFIVKKVRFPTQVEFVAQNYRQHKDLWYPQDIQITWPSTGQAKISVVSVTPATGDAKFKKLFDAAELNFGKDPSLQRSLADDPAIREFYTRLR